MPLRTAPTAVAGQERSSVPRLDGSSAPRLRQTLEAFEKLKEEMSTLAVAMEVVSSKLDLMRPPPTAGPVHRALASHGGSLERITSGLMSRMEQFIGEARELLTRFELQHRPHLKQSCSAVELWLSRQQASGGSRRRGEGSEDKRAQWWAAVEAGNLVCTRLSALDEEITSWRTCPLVGRCQRDVDGIDILSTFEGVHKVTLPLQWMEGRKSSKIFGSRYFDRNINRAVELLGMNTTSNRHGWGVGVDSFDRHLKNDFLLISLSHDTDAKPFVSTMEHRRAPIYGVQWHPESSSFNNNAWIDRTPADIEAAQWIGRFFVAEARKNEHRPISSLPRLEDFPLTKAGLWKEFYYSLP